MLHWHIETGTFPPSLFFFLGTIKVIANEDSEMHADYLEHLHYRAAESTNLQSSFLSEALSKPPSAGAHVRNDPNPLVGPKFD